MTATLRSVKKILVIDDHPVVRRGMAGMLNAEEDLEISGEASNAKQAMEAVKQNKPDLVLLDLSLGNDSGLELIHDLKAMHDDLAILVVSIHDESLFAERVLKAGAMGYINKQVALDHIVKAVRKVLSGKIYLSPDMANRMLSQVASGVQPGEESPLDRLSDREMEVYRMLGEGKGTREIAKRLHLSMKTIETYREHIKDKLNLKDSNEMVCHAARWVAEQT